MSEENVRIKNLIIAVLERKFGSTFVGEFNPRGNERVADAIVEALERETKEI